MRTNRTLIRGAALALILAVAWHAPAGAFFPKGAYNSYGQLKYAKWPMSFFEGGTGIPYVTEGGSLGFTAAETQIVRDAFQVWEDVPSSFVAFDYKGQTEDPLPFLDASDPSSGDMLNFVAIQWPDDPFQADVSEAQPGLTIATFLVDDGWVDIAGTGVLSWVTGGQILEADIIIYGPSHRSNVAGQPPLNDLLSTVVHEVGHFIGIEHTPLNNLEQTVEGLYESPAITLSDATGVARWVGATPTMFPLYFMVDDGLGGFRGGAADLAPDDIAAVSFLYPARDGQGNFFTISHDARSQTRNGFPSLPLGGGHVVAWCDTDDNPLTRRIPLFSTMTGLYEYYPANVGRFFLHGMYKNIQSPYSSTPIQATYTITCSPLNESNFERQAPFGPDDYSATGLDSIDGGADTYIDPPVWPSEVFHETGNLFGIEKYEVGTPLTFDTLRNTVVSVDSAKSLASMLPTTTPMFGDANQVCPLNVMTAGLASQATSNKLRSFRDGLLLKSSIGTMLVDAYYRMSPMFARFLIDHPTLNTVASKTLRQIETIAAHPDPMKLMLVILVALLFAGRRRLARVLMVALLCFMAFPAQALAPKLTEADMMAKCDDIITGTVVTTEVVEMQPGVRKHLATNVSIRVADSVKATTNINSTIVLRTPGGRRGNLITSAPDSPQFEMGQEVVVFIRYRSQDGTYAVVAGNRGTLKVHTDENGGQYVTATTPEAAEALKAAQKNIAARSTSDPADPPRVLLEDYKNYLRSIANSQKNK